MSRETSNLGLILYDPSEDKDVKVRDVINKVLGFTDSNTIKIDTKTKDIDTNIKTLHDSIIGTDGNVVFYNKQEVFLAVHPVGSIFLSTDGTEPAELYGGTWEQIKDVFLLGASDTYPVKSTGGSATHTQTKEELCPHSHRLMQSGKDAKMNTASMGRNGPLTSNVDEYVAFGDSVQLFSSYSFTIETVGGGQPMNILNPYYAVNIWRRIA